MAAILFMGEELISCVRDAMYPVCVEHRCQCFVPLYIWVDPTALVRYIVLSIIDPVVKDILECGHFARSYLIISCILFVSFTL